MERDLAVKLSPAQKRALQIVAEIGGQSSLLAE